MFVSSLDVVLEAEVIRLCCMEMKHYSGAGCNSLRNAYVSASAAFSHSTLQPVLVKWTLAEQYPLEHHLGLC